MDCYVVCPKCGGIEKIVSGKPLETWALTVDVKNGFVFTKDYEDYNLEEIEKEVTLWHLGCDSSFDEEISDFIVCIEGKEIKKMGEYWSENEDVLREILHDKGVLR